MTATTLAKVLEIGLLLWLGLMLAAVVLRLAKSDVVVHGLLAGQAKKAGKETQPERAIALLVFPIVLLTLIANALNLDFSTLAPGVRPSFPDVPDNLLTLLLGGNGAYLAGKIYRIQSS